MSMYDLFIQPDNRESHLFQGLTVGVVTNLEDPESLGRVKVKLTVRDDKENETTWARVLMPFVGNKMGAYFMPEVDDEVIVAFIGGQLEKPIVIGSVFNKKSKPPVDNEGGKNLTKMIKTKTGHTLEFLDDKGKGSISITTEKGAKIIIDDDKEKITVDDGANTITTSKGDGKVAIKADKKFEVKCGGTSVVLDGNANKITIKGTTVEIKGAQINAKGDTTMKLESGASLQIKGAMTQIKGNIVQIN